ncbi:MAG: glycosyltransferase family 4 protein, partial [Chloroflexales bacterium]
MSGVNISQKKPQTESTPTVDYTLVIDTFQPDIIDMQNVHTLMTPAHRVIARVLGLQWVIALLAYQRHRDYQAILATGEDIGLPLAMLLKYTGAQAPLIMTCHNISTRRPTFFLRRLRVGSAVKLFQCLAHAQASLLQERSATSANRIQMIYWHVDHSFFRPMPEVPIRKQICSAGMAARDYATLVAATDGLEIDVKIAADSPWFKHALNIRHDSLSSRVEARSYESYFMLRQLYAESQVVVVPLLNVNFSAGYTVILEAMAMGKAVIATKIAQRDDFIVDGWNGLYVRPGDVADLRTKLQFLIDNPEQAKWLGANARKTIEARFTLDHYLEHMRAAVA